MVLASVVTGCAPDFPKADTEIFYASGYENGYDLGYWLTAKDKDRADLFWTPPGQVDTLEIKVLGKGSKERVVPISPVTAGLMREYLAAYPEVKKGCYLFPANSVAGYQSTHNLERTSRRLCKKLGLPRITPHMLRHYFATYALHNGAKVKLISKILGHSSVDITLDVYGRVTQGEIHAEHTSFGPLSGGS